MQESEKELWMQVTKQAVRDLIQGLNGNHKKKGLNGKHKKVDLSLYDVNSAFRFLFDPEHLVSPALTAEEVIESIGCVRTVRKLVIKRCEADLKPLALVVFRNALRRL